LSTERQSENSKLFALTKVFGYDKNGKVTLPIIHYENDNKSATPKQQLV
jgi:hypothetical protein